MWTAIPVEIFNPPKSIMGQEDSRESERGRSRERMRSRVTERERVKERNTERNKMDYDLSRVICMISLPRSCLCFTWISDIRKTPGLLFQIIPSFLA